MATSFTYEGAHMKTLVQFRHTVIEVPVPSQKSEIIDFNQIGCTRYMFICNTVCHVLAIVSD
jgi:hypothetical protein